MLRACLIIFFLFQSVHAEILSIIKDRGWLNCGVTTGLPGFSYIDAKGKWQGFEVDYCRGLALAIFNDPAKVKFVPLANHMQFIALNTKQVDVLARVISVNYTRSTQLKGAFPVIHYFDDEAIMTYQFDVKQSKDLNDKTICLVSGSTAEHNLYRYAKKQGWKYRPLIMSRGQLAVRALAYGRCHAIAGDRSSLFLFRQELPHPAKANILKESIAIEPLSLMVREDDLDLLRLIQWMHYVLVNAEANHITKAMLTQKEIGLNAFNQMMNIRNVSMGSLPVNWMYQVVYGLGNYGEIFERNLTQPYQIPRNKNRLYDQGGLMYAPNLN